MGWGTVITELVKVKMSWNIKSYQVIFLVLLSLIGVAGFVHAYTGLFNKTYSIGIVLNLGGTDSKAERIKKILNAAQLRIDELNRKHAESGISYKLEVRDDDNDPDKARIIAAELAANPDVIAVLGYYDAESAIPAADIYNKLELLVYSPAVGSRQFLEKPWAYSGTIQDDMLASNIAAYLKIFTDIRSALVLSASGDYGDETQRGFADKAEQLGMKTKHIQFEQNIKQIDQRWLDQVVTAADDVDSIIILAKADDSAKIINAIRANQITKPIYGTDRAGLKLLDELEPAFKKDVFIAQPFVFEVGSMDAYLFNKNYKQYYGKEPSIYAAFAYDGISLIAEAIQAAGKDASRKSVKTWFDQRNSEESAFNGITGKLFFDKNRSVQRTAVMNRISINGQSYKPLFEQIRQVTEARVLRTLSKRVAEGEIVVENNVPYYKIQIVYVGIDFKNIINVDLKEESFQLDFYVWFRWKGDLDYQDFKFQNNTGDISLSELRSDLHSDIKWQSFQGNGTFQVDYDLRKFPFDMQELPIVISHKNKNYNKIQLVADVERLRSNSFQEVPKEYSYIGRQDAGGYYEIDSVFGNPTFIGNEKQPAYSQIQTNIDIKRYRFPYVINLLIPLGIIVALSMMTLFIPHAKADMRISLGMTAFLTVVVFQRFSTSSLPMLGYTTAADVYFLICYLLLFSFILKNFGMMRFYFAADKYQHLIRRDKYVDCVFVLIFLSVYLSYTVFNFLN